MAKPDEMNVDPDQTRPPTLAEIGRAGSHDALRPRATSTAAAPHRQGLIDALSRSDDRPDAWHRTYQWVVAAAITLVLAWLTYTREGWVPLLSYFDLGVHEFGHLLTMWAPDLIVWPAGSFLQVAAPLALGVYFLYRRDRFAVILMVAWAAESLHNVSVYAGDAQVMVLPLFGDDGSGAGHDWHNILGRLDLLESTGDIARLIQMGSVLLFTAALGLAAWWFVRARQGD
jgi:hypothetical protein